jgi:ABC-type transport system substrate-binding protein
MGSPAQPELLGQGQALPRWLSRDLRPGVGDAGGGDPWAARDGSVPRLLTAGAGPLVRCSCSGVEPDLALFKFPSAALSPVNYSRYIDRTLDALYEKQSRTADREERRPYLRDFEKRLLLDEAHYIYTFQWHRIVPHGARVRGWTITPSHFLNNQLDAVWLTE